MNSQLDELKKGLESIRDAMKNRFKNMPYHGVSESYVETKDCKKHLVSREGLNIYSISIDDIRGLEKMGYKFKSIKSKFRDYELINHYKLLETNVKLGDKYIPFYNLSFIYDYVVDFYKNVYSVDKEVLNANIRYMPDEYMEKIEPFFKGDFKIKSNGIEWIFNFSDYNDDKKELTIRNSNGEIHVVEIFNFVKFCENTIKIKLKEIDVDYFFNFYDNKKKTIFNEVVINPKSKNPHILNFDNNDAFKVNGTRPINEKQKGKIIPFKNLTIENQLVILTHLRDLNDESKKLLNL